MRELGLVMTLSAALGLGACGDDSAAVIEAGEGLGNAGSSGEADTSGGAEGDPGSGQTGSGDPGSPGTGSSGEQPGDPGGDGDGDPGSDGDGDPGSDGDDPGGDDPGTGDDPGGSDEAPATCDMECEAGHHCVLEEVTCVRDPCPPQPTCVPNPSCGGFAGFTCPGSGECVDDPSDDCDPENGGADCGGLCSCPERPPVTCERGSVWNSAPSVCACVTRVGGGGPGCAIILCPADTRCVEGDGGARCVPNERGGGDGESCGNTTCEQGMVCCNPSCGICTPPDGFCTQQICNAES